MPSITYDGRSFMLDGRRIWLVSGSVPYARVPRECWADRIHAAKLAGLNAIETPVFWNRHEVRPGQFDFKGENDLRHFVQLVAKAGMFCILRVGPFIGQDWDFGGLPPWLASVKNVKLRASNGPFLEACSRYISALAEQIRDLQITTPAKGHSGFMGGGGPVVLLQVESRWTCADETAANAYLGELNRYIREAGLSVPTINSNNLWAGVESELDGWTGSGDLLGTVRQLASVKPNQPRMVIEFSTGEPTVWGEAAAAAIPGDLLEQRLAQVLAAGGQFNLHPFCGGTNFGFWGGRRPESPVESGGYVTSSGDLGGNAPLREDGSPGPTFQAVRRICTFASRFSRLFANLQPSFQPVALNPSDESKGLSIIHASGEHGSVAFIFSGKEHDKPVTLLLADGTTMPVDLRGQPLTWCVFGVNLGGRSRLDYSSLSLFGIVGKAMVLFGPAGSQGVVSINGTALDVAVPGKGKPASTVELEGMTLVVCAREQIEHVYLNDDAVFVGVSGLSHDGHPYSLDGGKHCTKIASDGEVKQVPAVHPMEGSKGAKIALHEWTRASCSDYVDGSSARFAAIEGANDLTTLGAPFGYGWYRIRMKSAAAGRVHAAVPGASDRLHLFVDGEDAGLIGDGPGASREFSLSLKKGSQTLVILTENLGRLSGGSDLGEAKGMTGDIWEIKPIRAGKAQIKPGDPVDVLSFRSPQWDVQTGDTTLSDRLTWNIQHKKKQLPIFVSIPRFEGRALLLVNNKAVAFIDRGLQPSITLSGDPLKGGANLIQIALLPDHAGGSEHAAAAMALLGRAVEFNEGVAPISAKAEWAFAKWEQPKQGAYKPLKGTPEKGSPTWWRSTFSVTDTLNPVFFDAAGLTKGQIYVNGRHIGRYFVGTASGKSVPPQTHYFIPGVWLNAGVNEIVVFDEHGASPARCRLAYGA